MTRSITIKIENCNGAQDDYYLILIITLVKKSNFNFIDLYLCSIRRPQYENRHKKTHLFYYVNDNVITGIISSHV